MNAESSIEHDRETPDLEDLAAYLDGRLSEERRALVEERLLRDEEYYDLFMESAQFLQEDEEVVPAVEVVKHPTWQRSLKWAAPLAAAATVTLVIGWQLLSFTPEAAQWTSLMDAPTVINNGGKDWTNPGWSRLRGSGSTPPGRVDIDQARAQQLAFRMGTRVVQLQIALTAEDRKAAAGPAARLEVLTREDGIFFLDLPIQYKKLREQLDDNNLDDLRVGARELESQLLEILQDTPAEDHYACGIWNEVGRFAALSKDSKVLRRIWRQRRVAQKLYANSAYMDSLREALRTSQPDFEAAQKAFREIADDAAGYGL